MCSSLSQTSIPGSAVLGTSDKTERRAKVSETYQIVLLVGDQLRDFDERFKDRSVNYGKDLVQAYADTLSRYFVLLPNPTYGTYRDAVLGKGPEEEKYQRMQDWTIRHTCLEHREARRQPSGTG